MMFGPGTCIQNDPMKAAAEKPHGEQHMEVSQNGVNL